MSFIRVERAVKSFVREDGAEMRVLDGVSFEAEDSGITCLLGPSGCGKSTLLNAIAGLEKLDAGEIQFCVSGSGPSTVLKYSAVACAAYRTFSNVKVSAIMPRQPSVPNFIGRFIIVNNL